MFTAAILVALAGMFRNGKGEPSNKGSASAATQQQEEVEVQPKEPQSVFPTQPHGLCGLICAAEDIRSQLRTVSAANVIKQMLISFGPLQLAMIIKSWVMGMFTILR